MAFRLRAARPEDVEALFRLAQTTHMLNLPADRADLAHRVAASADSFAGKWPKNDPRRGEYVFVLEDEGAKAVIGTSAIIGQHGTRIAPHIAFEVGTEERYSPTVDIRKVHQTLRLVHAFDGPTEIGGLLLDAAHRQTVTESGVRLGTQLSFVRFLYMALHPERFQPMVMAEMNPPHVSEGWSPLWDALGQRFTGLTYPEADARWRTDKDFVEKLFPRYPVYVSLLPEAAQKVVGALDEGTKPALRLLESIGFRYSNHVDPFDGGPHYTVRREEITLVKKTVRRKLVAGKVTRATPALVAVDVGPASFRAIAEKVEIGETELTVPEGRLAALEAEPGSDCWATPL